VSESIPWTFEGDWAGDFDEYQRLFFIRMFFFNVIVLIDRYEYLNTVDRTPTTGGLASMIFLVPT